MKNRPPSTLVERGLFRPDLYYQLSGVDVQVPPRGSSSSAAGATSGRAAAC
jgi:transcriptional regulator of acetoin/glycerol metabolism